MHIIDYGKSSKEEFLNNLHACMKQILQKATHFVGVSLAPEVFKGLGTFLNFLNLFFDFFYSCFHGF